VHAAIDEHPVAPGNIGAQPGALILRLDGRLPLFGVISAQNNELWHITQTAPGQGWTGCNSLGAPSAAGGLHRPVVAQSADGRLEVFVTGSDGGLWHIWRTAPNQGWSGWLSHGSPPGFKIFGP
jgi:hypothetical protein